jgi:hypothetical protein
VEGADPAMADDGGDQGHREYNSGAALHAETRKRTGGERWEEEVRTGRYSAEANRILNPLLFSLSSWIILPHYPACRMPRLSMGLVID